EVRDWSASTKLFAIFTYDVENTARIEAALWPARRALETRATFQGVMADAGYRWFDYMQFTASPYKTPLSIPFAFVATHNHFVLDRGGKVFNRSAPVIKLSTSDADEHLWLIGILNSSAAYFWLKSVCYPKGGSSEPWENRFEFTTAAIGNVPVPSHSPLDLSRELDRLARDLVETRPLMILPLGMPG